MPCNDSATPLRLVNAIRTQLNQNSVDWYAIGAQISTAACEVVKSMTL